MEKHLHVSTKAMGKSGINLTSKGEKLKICINDHHGSSAEIELDPNTVLHLYDGIQKYFGEIISPKVTLEDAGFFRRFDWLHLPVED